MNQEFKFLMYRAADEDISVNAVIKDETIWLTQNAMAELFAVDKSSISRHLKNIFAESELDEEVVVAKIATTTQHGALAGKTQTRETKFYNLDAIISVGYRVNSKRATHFRIWATGILKEYMTKGFAMDDNRLKQGQTAFGKDYFRELLERVRSIRASERRIWQQVTDIFAECSIDYDKDSEITHAFYAMVQNKFHYAITGQTAAEIIYTHADNSKEKAIRAYISEQGASYVIPPQSNISEPWPVDWWLYKERHLVECFFQKLKWFRRIATRYDKLDASFLAFVYLASIAILLI